MSEQEYLEALIEEDPLGEANESHWEDFWLEDTYYEDTFEDDEEEDY